MPITCQYNAYAMQMTCLYIASNMHDKLNANTTSNCVVNYQSPQMRYENIHGIQNFDPPYTNIMNWTPSTTLTTAFACCLSQCGSIYSRYLE
jgi:hypothetical protein